MAFPQTVNPTTTTSTGFFPQGFWVVAYPPVVNAGDLLLLFYGNDSEATTVAVPAGWTQILQTDLSGPDIKLCVFARVADGTEGGTTFTVSFVTGSWLMTAHVYRITDWSGTLAAVHATVGNPGGPSVNPDSDVLAPSPGSADYLWFSVFVANNNGSISDGPDSYSSPIKTGYTGSVGNDFMMGSSRRELAAASDDPTSYTISLSSAWWAVTVAIGPAPVTGKAALAYNPITDTLFILDGGVTPPLRAVTQASIANQVQWSANMSLLTSPTITTPADGQDLAAVVN